MIRRIIMACLLLACPGCFKIDLYAPHGADVYLISSKAPVTVRRQWRTWFVLGGLAPVDNQMPDTQITREKLTEMRVVVIDTGPDALLGFIYNIVIPVLLTQQSMLIEGNRSPNDRGPTTMPAGS